MITQYLIDFIIKIGKTMFYSESKGKEDSRSNGICSLFALPTPTQLIIILLSCLYMDTNEHS